MKMQIVSKKKDGWYLKDYLDRFGPLPDEAIVLGVVSDGLPLLFNSLVSDSPNIMIWDLIKGNGLKILKIVAEFLFKYHNNDVVDTEFLVITQSPSDWEGLDEAGMGVNGKTSCIGVVPFYGDIVDQLLASMVTWINDRKGSRKPIMILIDGLENINNLDAETRRNFMYILMEGRKRNVYVVSTAQSKNGVEVDAWMNYFHLYVYSNKEWFETLEMTDAGKQKPILFFTPETEI